jgi:hypothetical protein
VNNFPKRRLGSPETFIGREEVSPEFDFWAGVHHRSSIAICIETENWVLITDSFFKYGNLGGHYLG